jgi:hypothetical protein
MMRRKTGSSSMSGLDPADGAGTVVGFEFLDDFVTAN